MQREPTTRRTALVQLATGAAAVVSTPTAALAAEPADPHSAWLAEIEECKRLQRTPGLLTDEEAGDLIFTRQIGIEDALYGTPARTLDGVSAQLRACLLAAQESTFGEPEKAGLANALATVEWLSGESDHV